MFHIYVCTFIIVKIIPSSMLGCHLVLSLCLSCLGDHTVKISWVWKKHKVVSTSWDCHSTFSYFWEDSNFGTSLLLPFWILCNSRKWCTSEMLPAEERRVRMWSWIRIVVYHPWLQQTFLCSILTCVGLVNKYSLKRDLMDETPCHRWKIVSHRKHHDFFFFLQSFYHLFCNIPWTLGVGVVL